MTCLDIICPAPVWGRSSVLLWLSPLHAGLLATPEVTAGETEAGKLGWARGLECVGWSLERGVAEVGPRLLLTLWNEYPDSWVGDWF